MHTLISYIIKTKVSIIIPTFNNLEKLKQCIFSLQIQRYTEFEVWIIDGASTDGTIDFLKTLPSKFKFISEKDNGIYDAMNKGIDLAHGEWLYFMGADDKLFSNLTLFSIFYSKNFDDVKLIIGNVTYDGNQNFNSSFSSKLWIKNTLHHQSVFYKKILFKTRKYDTSFKVLSDYHFNLYLYNKKINHIKINETIAICGAEGISKNYDWNLYREDIRLKIKNSNTLFIIFFWILGMSKYLFRKLNKKPASK
ncbi:glycosyltransferase family 2 protein [uncultured Tenacibaculum sp.]|uniref:glycosyltransferase family 2 protein n=1 Tax=uncultured Tenacibaculum sp. TaxID=174713 RepID=UPI002796255F|nr:glycosyltransferase family 2 protein [uncultured Tenacibaculum sp.]